MRKLNIFRKVACFFTLISFFVLSVIPSQVLAQGVLGLPQPGAMVQLSPSFYPVLLKGMQVHPDNPLRFDFIVDTGDDNLQGEELKSESLKLIKYFLASLTIPEQDLWVNLSPYEEGRITSASLGATEMGRDLLAQDYMLKQITSSLVYPEDNLGKKFWERVYKKAYELYGTTNVPANTFNKVWIIPDKALVYEHGTTAFVGERHLKVMLEEDYLSMTHNADRKDLGMDKIQNKDAKDMANVSSQVVREVLIPEIEKEVNEGKNFANLRQIYNSMILAVWYKQALKESLLGQVYADKNKVKGVDVQDKTVVDQIYNQYLDAFKKGAFNFIRVERDMNTNKNVPRKYFSGGAVAPKKVERQQLAALSPRAQRKAIGPESGGGEVSVVTDLGQNDPEGAGPGISEERFMGKIINEIKIAGEHWQKTIDGSYAKDERSPYLAFSQDNVSSLDPQGVFEWLKKQIDFLENLESSDDSHAGNVRWVIGGRVNQETIDAFEGIKAQIEDMLSSQSTEAAATGETGKGQAGSAILNPTEYNNRVLDEIIDRAQGQPWGGFVLVLKEAILEDSKEAIAKQQDDYTIERKGNSITIVRVIKEGKNFGKEISLVANLKEDGRIESVNYSAPDGHYGAYFSKGRINIIFQEVKRGKDFVSRAGIWDTTFLPASTEEIILDPEEVFTADEYNNYILFAFLEHFGDDYGLMPELKQIVSGDQAAIEELKAKKYTITRFFRWTEIKTPTGKFSLIAKRDKERKIASILYQGPEYHYDIYFVNGKANILQQYAKRYSTASLDEDVLRRELVLMPTAVTTSEIVNGLIAYGEKFFEGEASKKDYVDILWDLQKFLPAGRVDSEYDWWTYKRDKNYYDLRSVVISKEGKDGFSRSRPRVSAKRYRNGNLKEIDYIGKGKDRLKVKFDNAGSQAVIESWTSDGKKTTETIGLLELAGQATSSQGEFSVEGTGQAGSAIITSKDLQTMISSVRSITGAKAINITFIRDSRVITATDSYLQKLKADQDVFKSIDSIEVTMDGTIFNITYDQGDSSFKIAEKDSGKSFFTSSERMGMQGAQHEKALREIFPYSLDAARSILLQSFEIVKEEHQKLYGDVGEWTITVEETNTVAALKKKIAWLEDLIDDVILRSGRTIFSSGPFMNIKKLKEAKMFLEFFKGFKISESIDSSTILISQDDLLGVQEELDAQMLRLREALDSPDSSTGSSSILASSRNKTVFKLLAGVFFLSFYLQSCSEPEKNKRKRNIPRRTQTKRLPGQNAPSNTQSNVQTADQFIPAQLQNLPPYKGIPQFEGIQQLLEQYFWNETVQRSLADIVRNIRADKEFMDKFNNASMENKARMIADYIKIDMGIEYPRRVDNSEAGRDLQLVLNSQKAVCQGFATLFFFLGNAMGVPNEIYEVEISATGESNHVRNMVKLPRGKAVIVDLATFNTNKTIISNSFNFNQIFMLITKSDGTSEYFMNKGKLPIFPEASFFEGDLNRYDIYRSWIPVKQTAMTGAVLGFDRKVQNEYNRAVELFNQRKYDEAKELFFSVAPLAQWLSDFYGNLNPFLKILLPDHKKSQTFFRDLSAEAKNLEKEAEKLNQQRTGSNQSSNSDGQRQGSAERNQAAKNQNETEYASADQLNGRIRDIGDIAQQANDYFTAKRYNDAIRKYNEAKRESVKLEDEIMKNYKALSKNTQGLDEVLRSLRKNIKVYEDNIKSARHNQRISEARQTKTVPYDLAETGDLDYHDIVDSGEALSSPGGIDLGPASSVLQIKRDGTGMPLPLSQQPMEFQNIQGFTPFIINVTPFNAQGILGQIEAEESEVQLSAA